VRPDLRSRQAAHIEAGARGCNPDAPGRDRLSLG